MVNDIYIFPEKKITELSGIVIILIDHFNKFSFSFMFHLDESAGRKYLKVYLCVVSMCTDKITALRNRRIISSPFQVAFSFFNWFTYSHQGYL